MAKSIARTNGAVRSTTRWIPQPQGSIMPFQLNVSSFSYSKYLPRFTKSDFNFPAVIKWSSEKRRYKALFLITNTGVECLAFHTLRPEKDSTLDASLGLDLLFRLIVPTHVLTHKGTGISREQSRKNLSRGERYLFWKVWKRKAPLKACSRKTTPNNYGEKTAKMSLSVSKEQLKKNHGGKNFHTV